MNKTENLLDVIKGNLYIVHVTMFSECVNQINKRKKHINWPITEG